MSFMFNAGLRFVSSTRIRRDKCQARRIGVETPESRAGRLAKEVCREHNRTNVASAKIKHGAEPKQRVAVVDERDEGGARGDGSSFVGRVRRAGGPAGTEVGQVGGGGATSEQQTRPSRNTSNAKEVAEDDV